MVIDTKRCVGCHACVISCFVENQIPDGYTRSWITEITQGEFPRLRTEIYSERCNHCENAPCVTVCPTGASWIDEETGIVDIKTELCTGCKACMAACPYDARFVNPKGYADKCSFCEHRVKEGLASACATTCPTSAITFGDLENPASEIHKKLAGRQVVTRKPEMGTKPKIYYLK